MSKQASHQSIQERVVSMYERHPFPSYEDKFRKASEELFLKMRLLGLGESDYTNKKMLDCGCGTGEFTCWYAARGNDMTAIDLSAPSIERAKAYAKSYELDQRIQFKKMSVLEMDLPDDTFDIVYSYGVLHHTPDPQKGFKNMVRVAKPGGIVIVSVYSHYSRFVHSIRQKIINALAGDDVEKRFVWGKRLFPIAARKLKLRAHDSSDAILYDQFSIPHESLHTAAEILRWFDGSGLEYLGSFGPLRVRDYVYAAALPEYERIETTFDGSPLARAASGVLKTVARALRVKPGKPGPFPRPGTLSQVMVQTAWFFLGLRFSCFSIAARKPQN